MSLDALTDNELRALVHYNMECIRRGLGLWHEPGNLVPGDWERARKDIMRGIERIDRILAFKRVA